MKMTGRPGVTYLDVASAIATLQGKQKNPTVDSIREELGTGSRNTIAKHLLDWKSKNGIKNTTDAGIPIELQNLIQSLWGKIQSDADDKIKQHQIEANEEISGTKNQLAQTQQQNVMLHTEIQLLIEKLNIQISQNNQLNTEIQNEKNNAVKLQQRNIDQDWLIKGHKDENDRLHQLLKNTQDNLTHYQKAIEKQRSEQHMQLEKERSEYALKLNTLEKQIGKMSEEKSIIETKYQLLMDECQIQKNNLKMSENEKSHLQLKNSELDIKNNQLNSQNTKLQNEIISVTNSLKENEKLNHENTIQLAILKNENTSLNKKHELHDNKINLMQSDINNLLQENSALKQAIKETIV